MVFYTADPYPLHLGLAHVETGLFLGKIRYRELVSYEKPLDVSSVIWFSWPQLHFRRHNQYIEPVRYTFGGLVATPAIMPLLTDLWLVRTFIRLHIELPRYGRTESPR
jgi:hypothetical protein